MKIRLDGRMKWELLSAGGVLLRDGEQHNLLLNSGLDAMASVGFRGIAYFAAVGTGSAEPAVGQTTMGAELNRTAYEVGGGPTTTRTANGVYQYVTSKEFGLTEANGNLTEWGFATQSGILCVRELFRNGQGQPIVITKDNTQKLRLTYTLEIHLAPIVPTAGQVTVSGLGTFSGVYQLACQGTENADLTVVDKLMTGYSAWNNNYSIIGHMFFSTDPNYKAGFSYNGTNIGSTPGYVAPSVKPAYVTGSFRREGWTFVADTGQCNGTIYGVTISTDGQYSSQFGWHWAFDNGQQITKTDQNRISLVGPSVTWGRL